MPQIYGNGTTTASAGANTITHYYDKAGIKAANETNIYGQLVDRKSMPLKQGKTFKISKFLHIYDRETSNPDFASKGYLSSRDLEAVSAELNANVALGEGAGAVNKTGIKKVTFETSFARYGEMIDYTDEVEMFSEDVIQTRYREELGRLANRRTEDLIQLDMLGTTNRMFAGTATSVDGLGAGIAADGSDDSLFQVDYDVIRKAAKKLVRNRAKKNTSAVTGSTKIDTRTINKAYYAIIGPEVKFDLETLTRGGGAAEEFAYIPFYKYASATNVAEGEVGAMHDVRFIESETAVIEAGKGAAIPTDYEGSLSHTDGKFDAFPILFPTQGSFSTVGLKGHGKIKFNSKSPAVVSNENPYGTLGFFSYNFWYAGIILDEKALLRTDVCASA
jgi:N4-gp56 family major capsid protein